MGRRHILNKFQVWNNLDSTTPTVSEKSIVDSFDTVKYIVTVDPTVNGVLEVEFSDDKQEIDEVWKALDFGQQLIINGSNDTDYEIHIKDHASHKLRLKFTNAGGTGNINAWISGSTVGA